MLTLRGRFALVLGAAFYAVAWGFGIDEAYAVAVGLIVVVVAASAYVRVGAGPMRFVRRAGRGEHVEGADLPVRVEVIAENGVAPFGATLVDSLPGGEDQHVAARSQRRPAVRQLRAARPAARPLPARCGAPRDRGSVRARARRAAPRRRRRDGRLPAGVRPRPAVLRRRRARAAPAGACCSRAPRATTCTPCASTSTASRCAACDWKSTAKRGKLMVRELEDSPRDEACVVLDCEGGLNVGTAPDSSFEMQVRIAASILHHLGQAGHRSALVTTDGAHGEDAARLPGGRLARGARPAGRRPRRRPPLAVRRARGRARRPRRVPPLRRHREPQPAARRQAHRHAVRPHRHRRGLGRRAHLGPQGARSSPRPTASPCASPARASRWPACGAATTCAGRSPRAASTATSTSTEPSGRGRRHEGALAARRRRGARPAHPRAGDGRRHRARPRALRDLRDLHALARAHPAAPGARAARAARLGRPGAAAGADRRALDAPAAGGASRCSWCRCC